MQWDGVRSQEGGRISALPLGGLLSELLASEGMSLEDVASLVPASEPLESTPQPDPDAVPACDTRMVEGDEAPAGAAPRGLAAQLLALNDAAGDEPDAGVTVEAEPHFALSGLLLSLTEEAVASVREPPPAVKPALESVPHFALSGLLLSLTDETWASEQEPPPAVEPAPEEATHFALPGLMLSPTEETLASRQERTHAAASAPEVAQHFILPELPLTLTEESLASKQEPPPAVEPAPESVPHFALPGLLLSLTEETSASAQEPPPAVAPAPEETSHFALPGLLLSLTDETLASRQERPPATESAPEVAQHFVLPELPLRLTEEFLASEQEPSPAAEFAPEAAPHLALPGPRLALNEETTHPEPEPTAAAIARTPHGRCDDLSNLIGEIDDELAAAPAPPLSLSRQATLPYERFVVFRLGGASYGLPIRLVREVERVGRITPLPGAPGLVVGLINLHGEILPLLETRLLLKVEPAEGPSAGYLVVVETGDEEQPVAWLVDELGGIALVEPAAHATHRGRSVRLLDPRELDLAEELMSPSGGGGCR